MTKGMQPWKRIANALAAIILPASTVVGVSLIAAGAAFAQTYPTKPIKVILSVPPGSVIDVTARMVTSPLSERLGQPVVVENRPGGGHTIGVNEFARAAPDGHSLLFGSLDPVFAAKALGHDPVRGFVPIGTVASHAWILVVRSAIPATSVKELINHAKASPGNLNWGFGQSSAPHMFGEMFKAATGIDVANIPYKSGAQAVPDMLGGRIDMIFGTVSNLLPLIRDGKLRAIAITSATRSPELPDVPTLAESGFPRLTRGNWAGFWAPAATPADIVTKLNSEINAIVTTSAIKAAMQKLDFEPRLGSPQDFATFIRDEMDAWTPAANAAGMLPK